jgi:drug/metabolite transporter (DMT)-like permease
MQHTNKNGASRAGVILAYFLIYVVWGSTYYFIGVAMKGLPPFLLGAIRFTIAGAMLLMWCRHRGEQILKPNLVRKSVVSGIVLLFIDMAVVMLAQRYIGSSLVAIIAASTAIWIMALDVPMWKHNFRCFRVVAGAVTGFAGVALLYVEQFKFSTHLGGHSEYGVLLLVFGCISWALGTLYAKYRSSGAEDVNAFAGSAWQMLFAGGAFWLCAFIGGDTGNTSLRDVGTASWLALAYLIVFGSILAYTAYVWLLKVRPATEVATHAYVNPFVAVLIGTLLGNETVTWIQMAGLAVILGSVVLISGKRYKIKN